MIQPASPTPAPARSPQATAASDLLAALDKYAANFDLMVSAWKTRDIHDVVSDEFVALVQLQKSLFPDAAVVMIDLVMAHNDVAIVLLDYHRARATQAVTRFDDAVMLARQATHAQCVASLRGQILKKSH